MALGRARRWWPAAVIAVAAVVVVALVTSLPGQVAPDEPAKRPETVAPAAAARTVQSRHAQANIDNTIGDRKIRADVAKVFRQRPTTIVFNEAQGVAHRAIRAQARARGYGVYIPSGPAGQVVVAWKKGSYRKLWTAKTKVSDGISGVQPDRYVVRAGLRHRGSRDRVTVAGTHTIAYGWTTHRDEGWRRTVWHRHVNRMARVLAEARRHAKVVIWSGDMNRPRSTFSARPFPQFAFAGDRTHRVAGTGWTQYGPATDWHHLRVDYSGVIARRAKVRLPNAATVPMRSDHQIVLARYAWRG